MTAGIDIKAAVGPVISTALADELPEFLTLPAYDRLKRPNTV